MDTSEFGLYLKQNMYELACFATDKKMKEIWFCSECGLKDKVKKSLDLAEALAEMRSRTGNEELLLSEYVIYGCEKLS